MRRALALATALGALSLLVAAAASAAQPPQLTPVGRLPFPERGYVIDLPRKVAIDRVHVDVRENGVSVQGATLAPIASSGLSFATVLAIDASDSMRGLPFDSALGAARSFVDRRSGTHQIALLFFNGKVAVAQRPTASSALLLAALRRPPRLAYGTHIYDGLARGLALLERDRISSGSIILLSDGADVGSSAAAEDVVARARRNHVRIFTVGLRSKVFDPAPLAHLATATGGTFAQTGLASNLARIYGQLSGRLASEYLLEYRSSSRPGAHVDVSIEIGGVGRSSAAYIAPRPSGLAPYHRSFVSRFLLSSISLGAISLLGAGLAAAALLALLRRPPSTLVGRLGPFVAIGAGVVSGSRRHRRRRARRPRRPADGRPSVVGRWYARLEDDFDLSELALSPATVIAATVLATVLAAGVAGVAAPLAAFLALLVPLTVHSWIGARVKRVRDAFADQLPDTLQLLASALRSGYSFVGALSIVVEKAPEPSRRAFGQVLADDQLGAPIDESLRHVARRMASREMEQVALLGELQRTAGGNSAEVLDIVVETVRERAEVRRLARTMTAQGRMARWILTLLPIVIALFLFATQPELVRPLFHSGVGQAMLVASVLMIASGSLWIKHIVEIKV